MKRRKNNRFIIQGTRKKRIVKCAALWMILMLATIPALADFDFGFRELSREMTREMEKASEEYFGLFHDAVDLFGYDSLYSALEDDDKEWVNSVPEGEYIKVTYDQLLRELKENAFLAAKTYKDQLVCVEGRLSTIDSNGDYISLESDKYYFDTMLCYIRSQKALEQLMNLKSGNVIKVYGKITDVGEILGYYMDVYNIQ